MMAILLEGCDGAPVIWGKIGDYVIQRTKTGKMSIRRYKKPSNPRTPAQESNRTAFSAGLSRWTHYEKLYRKEYWDKQAKSRGFRDGYRAYLSGFMTLYHRKVLELSGTAEALVYVSDTANLITGEESISRITREKRGETLIGAILSYKNTGTYQKELAVTLSYLSSRGWLGNLRYALLPYSDPSKEWQIYSLELLSG